jgi:HlyD family secretion protein
MRLPRIGGIALAAVAALAGAARAQMGGPVAVFMEPAEVRSIRQSAELTGTAEPRRVSVVGAETAGRVEKMAADAGDHVAAGAPVCLMRRLPVELQLKQAEGLLASAQAQFKKAETGFRTEELHQAEARVKSARAGYERWSLDYTRTQKLFAEGASTSAEREAVESGSRQAKELLAEAEAGLALIKAGNRVEDIDNARAQVAAQTAAVEALRDTLAKMTVTMPFDGYVVRKMTEEGQWLAPGLPVVEVADLEVVRLQLDVPERYLAGLQMGARLPVVFDVLGDREFPGVVSQIVPRSSEGTHTIPVRVDVTNLVENGRPAIAAGLFAKVWLPVGPEHRAMLVPKSAVIRQDGRDVVYTVADTPPAGAPMPPAPPPNGKSGKDAKAVEAAAPVGPPAPAIQFAVAIPVKIIAGYGRYMEVESDKLKEGMPLVTRGTYMLSNGSAVQLYLKERIPAGSEAGAKAVKAPAGQAPAPKAAKGEAGAAR